MAEKRGGREMTDKEIVRALECCIKSTHFGECFENKCPMASEKGCKVGKETLYPYALDLINRLQAEIERLNKEVETEIDKLNAEKNDVMYYKDQLKSEAIKEFENLIVNNLIEQAYGRDYLLCLIKEWAKEMTEAME